MLRQSVSTLNVQTSGRGFYEITDEIANAVAKAAFKTGVATIHVQHTSASLVIQENADPDVRRDFERFFERLVPDGDPIFSHTSEGEDDMSAHIRSALTAVNLSVPIVNAKLALGTWQGVYLWEHRVAAHGRRVIVHLLGE